MNNVRERLDNLLSEIEADLKKGHYLGSVAARDALQEKVERASAKSRILDEGDRDFLIASKIALKDQIPWK